MSFLKKIIFLKDEYDVEINIPRQYLINYFRHHKRIDRIEFFIEDKNTIKMYKSGLKPRNMPSIVAVKGVFANNDNEISKIFIKSQITNFYFIIGILVATISFFSPFIFEEIKEGIIMQIIGPLYYVLIVINYVSENRNFKNTFSTILNNINEIYNKEKKLSNN